MDWARNGVLHGAGWFRSDEPGWHLVPELVGTMALLFQPARRREPLPDNLPPVDLDELAAVVMSAATRWNRVIRVAIGPALSDKLGGMRHRGLWQPAKVDEWGTHPGRALVALHNTGGEDETVRSLHHELWHGWHDDVPEPPRWAPGEQEALQAYARRALNPAHAAMPDATARRWIGMPLGGGEVCARAYERVATGHGDWPGGVAPDHAALAALKRLAGK